MTKTRVLDGFLSPERELEVGSRARPSSACASPACGPATEGAAHREPQRGEDGRRGAGSPVAAGDVDGRADEGDDDVADEAGEGAVHQRSVETAAGGGVPATPRADDADPEEDDPAARVLVEVDDVGNDAGHDPDGNGDHRAGDH